MDSFPYQEDIISSGTTFRLVREEVSFLFSPACRWCVTADTAKAQDMMLKLGGTAKPFRPMYNPYIRCCTWSEMVFCFYGMKKGSCYYVEAVHYQGYEW